MCKNPLRGFLHINFHGVKASNYGCLYCVLLLQSVNMEVVSRMYLALVLFSLLKETNLWNVAEKFQLSRGFIQSLLSSSSAFSSCVLHFTEVSTQLRSAINCHSCLSRIPSLLKFRNTNSSVSAIRSWKSFGHLKLC